MCSKRNIFIVSISYIVAAGYLSRLILDPSNDVARNIEDRVILMAFNLFVASPGFSLGLLIVFLRMEIFILTKDSFDLLLPPKGSIGNPIIDDMVGKRGIRFLNVFVKVLIGLSILIFGWAIYSALKKP